jgi:hypothetical protein
MEPPILITATGRPGVACCDIPISSTSKKNTPAASATSALPPVRSDLTGSPGIGQYADERLERCPERKSNSQNANASRPPQKQFGS